MTNKKISIFLYMKYLNKYINMKYFIKCKKYLKILIKHFINVLIILK